MKYAVIIKHPYRDMDYRVDLVDAPEDTSVHDIAHVIMREMLGPFEVISVTAKVSNRDISKGLSELKSDIDSHK